MINNIVNYVKKDRVAEPPWDYDFLINLSDSEYPKYLAKIFNYRTEEKLPLKKIHLSNRNKKYVIDKNKCKTFNQKLQWIKLYGITPLMCTCTDKVTVRDYVCKLIDKIYLKPALQICNSYKEIDFDKLPNAFIMKCSNGCKWQCVIKDKEDYIKTKQFIEITRENMNAWLEHEYWCCEGFELQYKNLVPKIIIEPLLREEINTPPREIEVYCFNGKPKILVNVNYLQQREIRGITFYNEDLSISDFVLHFNGNNHFINEKADDIIKQTIDLSIQLAQKFNFVRVDWLVYKNKLYFNELTFTPYSGFVKFDKTWNTKMGSWIELT